MIEHRRSTEDGQSDFVHLLSSRTVPCQLKPFPLMSCLFAYVHMDAHMVLAAICCLSLGDCAVRLA